MPLEFKECFDFRFAGSTRWDRVEWMGHSIFLAEKMENVPISNVPRLFPMLSHLVSVELRQFIPEVIHGFPQ